MSNADADQNGEPIPENGDGALAAHQVGPAHELLDRVVTARQRQLGAVAAQAAADQRFQAQREADARARNEAAVQDLLRERLAALLELDTDDPALRGLAWVLEPGLVRYDEAADEQLQVHTEGASLTYRAPLADLTLQAVYTRSSALARGRYDAPYSSSWNPQDDVPSVVFSARVARDVAGGHPEYGWVSVAGRDDLARIELNRREAIERAAAARSNVTPGHFTGRLRVQSASVPSGKTVQQLLVPLDPTGAVRLKFTRDQGLSSTHDVLTLTRDGKEMHPASTPAEAAELMAELHAYSGDHPLLTLSENSLLTFPAGAWPDIAVEWTQ